MSPRDPGLPEPYDAPSRTDPVVATATGLIGGPLGRYAVIGARGLTGVAAALVALAAVSLSLGVWQKGHCLMKGWSGPDHFWRACYSDLPVVHASSALARGALPWSSDIPSSQPPLSGLAMWLVARISPIPGEGVVAQQAVFGIWALLMVLLLAVSVIALVACAPGRPWQVAHLALSPVLVTLALVSTDLLGIALSALGLWALRSRRSWVAGGLLGLATLVRPFPLVFLAAAALLALRRRRPAEAGQLLVGAVLGALLVLVPLLLAEPRALAGARAWWGQGAGYGALQVIPEMLGLGVRPAAPVALALTGWVAALALGAFLALRRSRPAPGLAGLSALMLLVVALTAPALSVQSGLWVLPLLALSGVRWSDHLLWALAETVHFVATWLHLAFSADPGRGLPGEAYALLVLVRMTAWAWVLWRVWEEPLPAPWRQVDRAPWAGAAPAQEVPSRPPSTSRLPAGSGS